MTTMKLKFTSYSPSKKLLGVAASICCTPLSSGSGITALGYLRNQESLTSSSSSTHDSRLSFRSPRRIRIVFAPVATSSASSSSHGSSQEQLETDEDQLLNQSNQKTVHLKLQLRRECQFGEQFLIVGNDPLLGIWDPSNAILMNWSDDHLWTVELDLPIDRAFQFKFILRKVSKEILWQPGEDRTLQLWETENIVTVLEDWDDEQARVVKEEQGFLKEPVISNPEMTLVADDEAKPVHEDRWDCCVSGISISSVQEEESDVTASSSAVDENINGASKASQDDPVLVSGLPPSSTSSTNYDDDEKQFQLFEIEPTDSTSEAHLDAQKSDDKTRSTEKVEEGEVTELISSTIHQLAFSTDYNKPAEVDHHWEVVEESATEKFVWEYDINWVRETLRKFLNSLGFL